VQIKCQQCVRDPDRSPVNSFPAVANVQVERGGEALGMWLMGTGLLSSRQSASSSAMWEIQEEIFR